MREIVHLQAGQCGNQIGAKVRGTKPPLPLIASIHPFSFGKSSPTSTVSTPPVPIMETLTSSWRGSTSTTTRPPEASTSPGLSWLILSLVLWTPFALDHLDKSSDLTTLSLVRKKFFTCVLLLIFSFFFSKVKVVPVTTGLKVTTLKVPN